MRRKDNLALFYVQERELRLPLKGTKFNKAHAVLRCHAVFVFDYRRFAPAIDSLAPKDSSDILLRNVGKKNYQHTLRYNPEERRPQLHRGGSLKSRRF
jgi:hypothetical protein